MRALPLDGGRLVRAGHRQAASTAGRTATSTSARSSRSRRPRAVRRRCSASTRRRSGRCCAAGGPGKLRRGARARRQGVPSRRQDRGDADPGRLRSRRREPAHLHRLGLGHLLERVRREPRRCTARARSSIRGSTIRSSSRSPRGRASATSARDRRSDHAEARRAALLPARDPGAACRRTGSFDASAAERGRALFDGQGEVRDLPRAAALHRAGLERCTPPSEIGIDDFQASRSPDGSYRTTPLARPVHARRRAASTTTAASRRSTTSSSTTPACSRSGSPPRGARGPRRVPEVALIGTGVARGERGVGLEVEFGVRWRQVVRVGVAV